MAGAEAKHLPLEDLHRQATGHFGDFAGRPMWLAYPAGAMGEHEHSRTHARLFDIFPTELIARAGADSGTLFDLGLPLDPAALLALQTKYFFPLDGDAEILDDVIVARPGDDRFMLVANAGNAAAVETRPHRLAEGLGVGGLWPRTRSSRRHGLRSCRNGCRPHRAARRSLRRRGAGRHAPLPFIPHRSPQRISLVATTYYTEDHEWLRVEGDVATVGITDYAQGQLGDIVFVGLPDIGTSLTRGDSAVVVESVKAASDVYAPVDGEVIEANDVLTGAPALVNSAATGDGWLWKMKLSDRSQLEGLMDEAAYSAHAG